MKKIILLVLLVSSITIVSAAVEADLTGSLQLKGSPKSSENFLDLLKCGLDALPKKFLRKEKVKATYTGAARVTLEQETDGEEKFLLGFRVPTILRLVSGPKKIKKEVVKNTTASVECADADEEVNNTGTVNDNFTKTVSRVISKHRLRTKKLARTKLQRKQNKIKKFLRDSNSGLTFTIQKLVAVRKGNKGKVKANFVDKERKARGRFVVKFDYKD